MKRRLAGGLSTLILVVALAWLIVGTTGCDSGSVYVGVSVAGPYGGYRYGYHFGCVRGGGVVYGRPYYR